MFSLVDPSIGGWSEEWYWVDRYIPQVEPRTTNHTERDGQHSNRRRTTAEREISEEKTRTSPHTYRTARAVQLRQPPVVCSPSYASLHHHLSDTINSLLSASARHDSDSIFRSRGTRGLKQITEARHLSNRLRVSISWSRDQDAAV